MGLRVFDSFFQAFDRFFSFTQIIARVLIAKTDYELLALNVIFKCYN